MLTTVMRTRATLTLIMLFLFSMTMSCQELQYMVRGKTIDATFLESHIEKDTERRGQVQRRVVGYGFTDKDTFRHEYANVPLNWPGVDSPTVKVEYLPGWENHSRILGQSNRIWVTIFFACLAAAILWLIVIVKNPSFD